MNSIVATPAAGAASQDVERRCSACRASPRVEAATDFSEPIDRRMDDFVEVLRLTEAFALALALLIAFNSSSISADERRREYATMFAFGVPLRRRLRIAIVESLVVGRWGR